MVSIAGNLLIWELELESGTEPKRFAVKLRCLSQQAHWQALISLLACFDTVALTTGEEGQAQTVSPATRGQYLRCCLSASQGCLSLCESSGCPEYCPSLRKLLIHADSDQALVTGRAVLLWGECYSLGVLQRCGGLNLVLTVQRVKT